MVVGIWPCHSLVLPYTLARWSFQAWQKIGKTLKCTLTCLNATPCGVGVLFSKMWYLSQQPLCAVVLWEVENSRVGSRSDPSHYHFQGPFENKLCTLSSLVLTKNANNRDLVEANNVFTWCLLGLQPRRHRPKKHLNCALLDYRMGRLIKAKLTKLHKLFVKN